ncbi:DUF2480 family protein [Gilvibacter sp.]|uniref:DUF2480 family protein n=1 Tax=Gilvibacter sp. TaxID=2729997 RepID=UPI0025B7C27E|nr:DUF2480 family protein [Gilvibacter sp.]NQX76398.1 DUF2480 family protein [Gilvibacter sp.]
MEDPIVNRVAKSPLVNLDLEELFPEIEVAELDISQWLTGGFILKEKELRTALEAADLSAYADKVVALHCSTDAILPGWAFMLVAAAVNPLAELIVLGDKATAMTAYAQRYMEGLDLSEYQDRPVIIKGCGDRDIPEQALITLSNRLQGIAKSVLFGEACSSVPVYKRR